MTTVRHVFLCCSLCCRSHCCSKSLKQYLVRVLLCYGALEIVSVIIIIIIIIIIIRCVFGFVREIITCRTR